MNNTKVFYYFFSFIVLVFCVLFLTFMPNEWFRDRDNYLIYASSSNDIFNAYGGYLVYFNEPLFLKINHLLSTLIDYKYIPSIFVFFISFTYFFNLIEKSRTVIVFFLGVVLMLTIPYIIQSQLVALRQGLATAFFMWCLFRFKDDKHIAILILLCGFVHAIFFLIFVFYCLNFLLFKNVEINKKILFNFLGMVVFSVFSIAIAKFFGLRQGDEYTQEFSRGGGGAFVLFLIVFAYLYLYGNRENKKLFEFSILGIVLFLSAYFITPIAGRFFNTIAPFVVLLLVQKSRLIDVIFLSLISLVFIVLMVSNTYLSLLTISDIVFFEKFYQYFQEFISL